jgi:hypothetical protein
MTHVTEGRPIGNHADMGHVPAPAESVWDSEGGSVGGEADESSQTPTAYNAVDTQRRRTA